jgi:hypothetical protein
MGYDVERVKATHAAREKILASRFAPRQPVPGSQTPGMPPPMPPDRSTSETLDTPISPEEAQFWRNVQIRLRRRDEVFQEQMKYENVSWNRVYPWGYYKFGSLDPALSDWNSDSSETLRRVVPGILKSIEQERIVFNAEPLQHWLREMTECPTHKHDWSDEAVLGQTVGKSDVSKMVETGTGIIEGMNQIERVLLETDWKQEDFLVQNGVILDRNPAILAVHRAVLEGKPEKAARLIERYVLLSGESYFVHPSCDKISRQRGMECLERFLARVARDPGTPEDILEWTATTLASWKLTSREYQDLCDSNLYRYREIVYASLGKGIDSGEAQETNGWHFFFSGVPEKAASSLARPFLLRVFDRKVEALCNQDEAEYEKAQKNFEWVSLAMNLRNPSHENWEGSYRGLLMQNALAYDQGGSRLENPGKMRKTSDSKDPTEVSPPSGNENTLFAALASEEKTEPDAFNRAIEMTRLAFASARYRREHGRYPGSVPDLIPRYLDESFAPTPDQIWAIVWIEPFTAVTAPDYSDQSPVVTRAFVKYLQASENMGRIPSGIEALRPYAPAGTDLSPLTSCFVPVERCPLYCLVVRHDRGLFEQIQQTSTLKGESVSLPDTASQYLYFSIPPRSLENVTSVQAPPVSGAFPTSTEGGQRGPEPLPVPNSPS